MTTIKYIFKLLNSMPVIIMACLWVTFSIFPNATYWIDLKKVGAEQYEHTQGEEVELFISRDIKRDFTGSYDVTLRKYTKTGIENVCEYPSGLIPYKKDAELPETPDLAWWTGNKCKGSELEPGTYFFDTCHTVYLPIVKDRNRCVQSEEFTIRGIRL